MKFPQNLLGKILLCLFLFWAYIVSAQTTFTESAAVYGLDLGQGKDGGHAWSDFDNDGDLDVLVLENNNNGSVKSFLMQNNSGVFTNVQATLAPGMLGDRAERQAAWGDVNSDGRPDFMINSYGTSSTRIAIQIFIQNTDGTFGNGIGGSAPLTVGENSSATITINPLNTEGTGFFDFEGDGDLDIFFDNHNFGIEILRNNYIDHTTHTVVNPTPAALFTHITTGNGSGVVNFGLNQFATDGDYGSAADVNDDGWVDIFMRKRNENDFFLNQGGTFSNGSDLAQADNGNKGANGLWDLDNDGDLDAVWTENGLNQIFRNDGPGIWTPLGSASFPGLPQPSDVDSGSSSNDIDALAGGDIDNDGDIDILFVGDSRSYLFINQLNSPTPAPGVIGSGTAMTFSLDPETFNTRNGEGTTMIDIDDDGDLDIYMNINHNSGNQLWINNLPAANRNNHLVIDVSEDRGANGSTGSFPERTAIGTNVILRDCEGNIISGLRQVNGVYGHGTQSPEEVHFGLPLGEGETYTIEVRYPNFYDPLDPSGFSRLIATIIATPSTVSGTNRYDLSTTDAEIVENINPPDAVDDTQVVSLGNTVSVQISLFDNDSEPDGENFFISSIVQPAIGSVTIDDADAGLVTYTYSAGTPFPGTTFDYTITDSTVSICPALGKSDTATVTVYEPCADPLGVDTDADGINDICDRDDDNDGILDDDEGCLTHGQTLVSQSGVGNPNGILGAPDASFAEIHTNGDVITVDFQREFAAGTQYIITWRRRPGRAPGEVAQPIILESADNNSFTQLSVHPQSSVDGVVIDTLTSENNFRYLRFTKQNTPSVVDYQIDALGVISCIRDTDLDGVLDYLDLDSDNDGIYDVVEAGHDMAHVNGRLTGSIGLDGIVDAIQGSGQEDAGSVNYTLRDSNTDGDEDFIESDSDSDGCNDVLEAGFTESGTMSGELQGTGYNTVTGVITGNTNGYATPVDADTNGTYDYRQAETAPVITAHPQDQNVADGSNALFSITASGTNLAYQWQVSTDGGINYNDISGETAATLTIIGASAIEDGNFYRVILSNITLICTTLTSNSAVLTIGSDFDNDGVVDTDDLDDDNDGILDTVEANNCDVGDPQIDVVIFSEDFGSATGNRVTTPYTNYPFEDGTGSSGGNPSLQDGEYTIFEDITATAPWAASIWQTQGDHTTGSDRMMIVNANNTAGLEFYRRTLVQVSANVPLDISFWVMNLDTDIPSNNGRSEPDITVLLQQGGSTVYTFNTNAVAREANGSAAAWKNYSGSFTPTTGAALEMVLINNAPGGLGNDLALDDIVITQSFCDSDGDGSPNSLEVDSDGDGCNDSDEAYANPNADSDDNGMYGTGSPAVNPDGTVVEASYQMPADGNTNTIYDFLESGAGPSITNQPADVVICPGCIGSIAVLANNSDSYQWQLFNGTSWVDLNDAGIYSGTSTASLTITNPTNANNNSQYRVIVSNTAYVCDEEIATTAVLTIAVTSVITNRRITYRVQKN